MTHDRVAYMPLITYPEAIADDAIRAAVAFAGSLGCTLSVTAFAVTCHECPPGWVIC